MSKEVIWHAIACMYIHGSYMMFCQITLDIILPSVTDFFWRHLLARKLSQSELSSVGSDSPEGGSLLQEGRSGRSGGKRGGGRAGSRGRGDKRSSAGEPGISNFLEELSSLTFLSQGISTWTEKRWRGQEKCFWMTLIEWTAVCPRGKKRGPNNCHVSHSV